MRIIIACSDDSLRRFLSHLLEGVTEDARTVSRSGELLKAVLASDFDLVVIALHLRGMSGQETLPILKRIRPKLPVFVLSDDSSLEVRADAFENGALHYFMLPVHPSAFLAAVNEVGAQAEHRSGRAATNPAASGSSGPGRSSA